MPYTIYDSIGENSRMICECKCAYEYDTMKQNKRDENEKSTMKSAFVQWMNLQMSIKLKLPNYMYYH